MEQSVYSEIQALHHYIDFIKKCSNKIYTETKLEKHHIVPKFVLLKINPEATKRELDENNVVSLSRDDHIIAHDLLSKCYEESSENYVKNIWSIQILSKNKHKTDSISRCGKNNPFYGKYHSNETKNKLSNYTKLTRTNVSYKELYKTEERIREEINKRNITRSEKFKLNRENFIRLNEIEFIDDEQVKIKGVIYKNIKSATRILGWPKNKLYTLKNYYGK